MKKLMMLVLAMLVAFGAVYAVAQEGARQELDVPAWPEQEDEAQEDAPEMEEFADLCGEIVAVGDDHILVDVPELGEVQVWLNDDTIIEGVDALEIGQTAFVLFNGMMTRSLPPQVTALRVSVYRLEGVVTELLEGGVMVMTEQGEVRLSLPEDAMDVAVGEQIVAYTTGISTMSLPPQMIAVAIAPAAEATPGEATPAEATPDEAAQDATEQDETVPAGLGE
ncbi:MAG: hypothetical protein ACI4PG_02805 [Candidatus Ventricola sp.]